MQFQRLKVSGFKSFVEPTEFRIEPGLTGVVGPNGCGKSNLLEALRWVMGANSAKAMRADGMDDVIFGGTAQRPSRNHAEVSLQIDNAARRAPAQFNDHPMLEVARRISRGGGSTYRVNGVETRARDVQLLFADASSGANSPAMVRQGQISELISAKPSNRRRMLEEAAGVAGLHARRQEAHLRLNAAQANLTRLDDVAREIEQGLNRLKREARQAEKYKRLSAEIRALETAALLARWTQAEVALGESQAAFDVAVLAVEAGAQAAARAVVAAATAAGALAPLRDEAMTAAAVLQRLTLERDRLDRDIEQAAADEARLEGELERNEADRVREAAVVDDARATLDRLDGELADVERAIAAAPDRAPELEQARGDAQAARVAADTELERRVAEAAAEGAHRAGAAARLDRARADHRLVADRLAQATRRRDRIVQALEDAERARGGALADDGLAAARTSFDAAVAELAAARRAITSAEDDRAAAARAESETRDAARAIDDQLRRLRAEAQGLIQLSTTTAKGGYPPALDQVIPAKGYEAAVAAAFGEDLDAALDPTASAFWAGRDAPAPLWPTDAAPLAVHVSTPTALNARLSLIAVVDRADGARLQASLPVGGRIVSREGDLWRWDGFTVRADAPRPAAKRLAQKARLAEIDDEITGLTPRAQAVAASHAQAVERVRAGDRALAAARAAAASQERKVAQARDGLDRHSREAARLEARHQALDETLARLRPELQEADQALADLRLEADSAAQTLRDAEADVRALGTQPSDTPLVDARRRLATAREGEARALNLLEAERRARDGRLRRRDTLGKERADWIRRGRLASDRAEARVRDRDRIDAALFVARGRPAELRKGGVRLLDELSSAEARRARADDALAEAQAVSQAGDRAARDAEQHAAHAREHRAAAAARLDAARARMAEGIAQIHEATGLDGPALQQQIAAQAFAIPPDPAALDAHLIALRRERDGLGAVNLRADEDASSHDQRLQTLLAERADLTGALTKLRDGVAALNAEGRERLLAAFDVVNTGFQALFQTLFDGGQAELRLVESDDPLEAGLEIFACPPGKRLAAMSLMSGGEQALTACALILAVFLSNPAPVCVLDEVDAPLDDANVDRFCRLLDEMRRRTDTRFIAITHNPVTMSRMDRLFGVTMQERGVSRLVSVDLRQAEALAG